MKLCPLKFCFPFMFRLLTDYGGLMVIAFTSDWFISYLRPRKKERKRYRKKTTKKPLILST